MKYNKHCKIPYTYFSISLNSPQAHISLLEKKLKPLAIRQGLSPIRNKIVYKKRYPGS